MARTRRKKPEIQELIGGLNDRLTVPSQDGALQSLDPRLQIQIQANDAIRELRWFDVIHTMVATQQLSFVFAAVPSGEVHIYHSIRWAPSTGDQRIALINVTYPSQGILAQDALLTVARARTGTGGMPLDLLGNAAGDGLFSLGRPLKVYPNGILTILSANTIAITATVRLGLLWEVGAAPLEAVAELLTPVITEF